jgi:hypothetical protein
MREKMEKKPHRIYVYLRKPEVAKKFKALAKKETRTDANMAEILIEKALGEIK